jgi:hypothetical protein
MTYDDYFDPPVGRRGSELLSSSSSPPLSSAIRASAQRALERAANRLALLDKFPDIDPYSDNTVLWVRRAKRHAEGSVVLTYAILRIGGKWWSTGQDLPRGASWNQLVDWLTSGGPVWVHEMDLVQKVAP